MAMKPFFRTLAVRAATYSNGNIAAQVWDSMKTTTQHGPDVLPDQVRFDRVSLRGVPRGPLVLRDLNDQSEGMFERRSGKGRYLGDGIVRSRFTALGVLLGRGKALYLGSGTNSGRFAAFGEILGGGEG